MFTISSKGSYGLQAVFELGLNYNKGPVQIKTIAENQNIPQHYLEQILVKLKNAGLVKSYRGAQGGYTLALKPSEITIYDILANLEGGTNLVNEPGSNVVIQNFWKDAEHSVEQIFAVTVEELIYRHHQMESNLVFNI